MTEQSNRFSGMMGDLGQGASDEPKATVKAEQKTKTATKAKAKVKGKAKKSTVKSRDPDYTQIGLYLPNELHKKMKMGAVMNDLELSDLAAQAVELWLKKNAPNI